MACTQTQAGHAVHFLQARHFTDSPSKTVRLSRIWADGRLQFDDGTTWWNHDPEQLAHTMGDGPGQFNGNLLKAGGRSFSLRKDPASLEGDRLGTGEISIPPAPYPQMVGEEALRAKIKTDYEAAAKS